MVRKKSSTRKNTKKAMRRNNSNIYYLSEDEISKIIDNSKNLHERVILKILARTGVRRFELKNLKVNDVDFENRRILIRKGKGSIQRLIPVDEDTVFDIKSYIDTRKRGYLIRSEYNGNTTISLSGINKLVGNVSKRAGVKNPDPRKKNINPHIFRHSFVRNNSDKMPLNVIQYILGHSHIGTTLQIYGQMDIRKVQASYDRAMGQKMVSNDVLYEKLKEDVMNELIKRLK